MGSIEQEAAKADFKLQHLLSQLCSALKIDKLEKDLRSVVQQGRA